MHACWPLVLITPSVCRRVGQRLEEAEISCTDLREKLVYIVCGMRY